MRSLPLAEKTMTAAESLIEEIRMPKEGGALRDGSAPVQSRMRRSLVGLQLSVPPAALIWARASATGMPARNPAKLNGGSVWAAGAMAGGGTGNGMGAKPAKT